MKTSNYLAKLPQETTTKNIQVLKNYDIIALDVPTASRRLCPQRLRYYADRQAYPL